MTDNSKISRFPCPCCGYLTRDEMELGSDRICPVCRWHDDYSEGTDPNYSGGPNHICLFEARKNFKSFGAKTLADLTDCRPPRDYEYPPLTTVTSDSNGDKK